TRQLGDQAGEARLLRSLGLVLLSLADYRRATGCLEDALAIQERLGNRLDMQRTLRSLAVVDIAAGSFDYARDRLERSAAMARETGDEWGLATSFGAQAEQALEL